VFLICSDGKADFFVILANARIHSHRTQFASLGSAAMTVEATYWIYILASGHHGTLYTGVTNDLPKRLDQHRSGQGSRFVSKYKVDRLVYLETFATPQDAIAREKQLKNWWRDRKSNSSRETISTGAICPAAF
jgi:putative endonuclease